MKASEFKKLIKEAVREAIREELSEGVQQPVQEVSKPAQPVMYTKTGNPMIDALNETRTTMASGE